MSFECLFYVFLTSMHDMMLRKTVQNISTQVYHFDMLYYSMCVELLMVWTLKCLLRRIESHLLSSA